MAEKKKYKLDLYNKFLPAIMRRDVNIYSKLSDEERKGFADIVALRTMSSAKTNDVDILTYLILTANSVNKHMWNSAFKGHDELKMMTFAAAGPVVPVEFEYIAAKRKKTISPKVLDVLKRYYPTASESELKMFIDINDAADLIEIGLMLGMQKDKMTVYKKEVKKLKK